MLLAKTGKKAVRNGINDWNTLNCTQNYDGQFLFLGVKVKVNMSGRDGGTVGARNGMCARLATADSLATAHGKRI